MRIIRTRRREGIFWLPSIKKEMKGTLIIHDGGKIRLQLEDWLSNPNEDTNSLISVIHGRLGKISVTLIDSYNTPFNFKHFIQGKYPCEMHVHEAVIGGIFESPDIESQEVTFSIEGIDERCLQLKYPLSNNQIQLSENSSIFLLFNNKDCLFKITTKTYENLCYFQKIIKIIMLFFCFIFDKVFNLKKLSITSGMYKNLSVYYQSIPFELKKGTSFSDFLKPDDIGDLLTMIKKWIEFYKLFFPALNLYFSFLTHSHSFAETKFIALSQALEAFHRLSGHNQNALEPEEFDELKTNILDHCSSSLKHKEWLTEQFTHLNKINLRKRIKELIKPFNQHFGTNKQREDLISDIMNTRNGLTHLTLENMQMVYDKNMMIELCFRMDVMLCLLILSELGFNHTDISKVVTYDRIQFNLKWKEKP